MSDNVNHPSHYTFGKYEAFDVMLDVFGVEAMKTYCRVAAFKYLWRSEHKNGQEDIEKADWYLLKYLELNKESEQNESDDISADEWQNG